MTIYHPSIDHPVTIHQRVNHCQPSVTLQTESNLYEELSNMINPQPPVSIIRINHSQPLSIIINHFQPLITIDNYQPFSASLLIDCYWPSWKKIILYGLGSIDFWCPPQRGDSLDEGYCGYCLCEKPSQPKLLLWGENLKSVRTCQMTNRCWCFSFSYFLWIQTEDRKNCEATSCFCFWSKLNGNVASHKLRQISSAPLAKPSLVVKTPAVSHSRDLFDVHTRIDICVAMVFNIW